jgi:D-serine deaminase-like pyridoxal phosphate-dependent protein
MSLSSLSVSPSPNAAPAARGSAVADVDTPALLIDLDALEANMATVHQRVIAAGLHVRSHGKAHKCPAIARLQLAAGALGICCQKASEAEAFADAGITDILITNQLVGARKVDRAALLAHRVKLGVCVDHALQIEQIGEAARRHDSKITVMIEVDVGLGRCGISSAEAALLLAAQIRQYAPALTLGGIHAYTGGAQHLRGPEEREAAVAAAVERVSGIKWALESAGFPCPTVTGAGTGTYMLEAASSLYTEVQPGSYVLMDADYAANRLPAGAEPLRHALFGLCTVISVQPTHAVLDGGLKTFAVDHGLPQILASGWTVKSLSDEHCVVVPDATAVPLHVGDKVRLIPGHCDPTVNLHDWLVAYRGDQVEDVWPVLARGALF